MVFLLFSHLLKVMATCEKAESRERTIKAMQIHMHIMRTVEGASMDRLATTLNMLISLLGIRQRMIILVHVCKYDLSDLSAPNSLSSSETDCVVCQFVCKDGVCDHNSSVGRNTCRELHN